MILSFLIFNKSKIILNKKKFQKKIISWSKKNKQEYPWRKKLPFWQGLICEMMLQRTKANQVEDVFTAFTKKFSNLKSLHQIKGKEVIKLLKPLGLEKRNQSIKNLLIKISKDKFKIKKNQLALEQIPGVGKYTASATLSFYGEIRATIVDSNISRMICRILGKNSTPETRRQKWLLNFMEEITPQYNFKEFNYGLLDLSMIVCSTKNPKCSKCPINDICKYYKNNY